MLPSVRCVGLRDETHGEVAERSNAADCKSVALAASEVRILPSPPAFARSASFGQAGKLISERGTGRLVPFDWGEAAGGGIGIETTTQPRPPERAA